jgi:hypothetical protein
MGMLADNVVDLIPTGPSNTFTWYPIVSSTMSFNSHEIKNTLSQLPVARVMFAAYWLKSTTLKEEFKQGPLNTCSREMKTRAQSQRRMSGYSPLPPSSLSSPSHRHDVDDDSHMSSAGASNQQIQ